MPWWKKTPCPAKAELAPDEGQETGGRTWKKVTLDTAYLDFATLIGKPGGAVAYACTHVYSPAAATLRMNLTYVGQVRVCVNGKAAQPMGPRFGLNLAQGWNRILLKVSPGDKTATGVADWYVVPVLHGVAPCQYEETNIAWRTPLPAVHPGFYGGGTGVGTPVIVGDRVYLQSEPHDLICISKADGRVLWVRRASAFEAATSEERNHPAYQEAEAAAAKIDAINAAFVAGAASDEDLHEKKAQLEKELAKHMKRVNPEKYTAGPIPDVGFSGFTPSSDGQFLYAWFGDGITACYDLDGNRRWIRVDGRPPVEHGFSSSPLLIDGKFVVFMRDLLAFDAATGELAWQVPLVSHNGLNPAGFFHGSLVAATVGGTSVIVLGNGTIVRASRRQGALRRRGHGQPGGRLSGGRGGQALPDSHDALGLDRANAARTAHRSVAVASPEDRPGPVGVSQALSPLALVLAGDPPGAGVPDEQRGRAYGRRCGCRRGRLSETARLGRISGS